MPGVRHRGGGGLGPKRGERQAFPQERPVEREEARAQVGRPMADAAQGRWDPEAERPEMRPRRLAVDGEVDPARVASPETRAKGAQAGPVREDRGAEEKVEEGVLAASHVDDLRTAAGGGAERGLGLCVGVGGSEEDRPAYRAVGQPFEGRERDAGAQTVADEVNGAGAEDLEIGDERGERPSRPCGFRVRLPQQTGPAPAEGDAETFIGLPSTEPEMARPGDDARGLPSSEREDLLVGAAPGIFGAILEAVDQDDDGCAVRQGLHRLGQIAIRNGPVADRIHSDEGHISRSHYILWTGRRRDIRQRREGRDTAP